MRTRDPALSTAPAPQSPALADLPNGVALVRDTAEFGALRDPGCAAALWSRSPPRPVSHWLDTLDPARLPRGRVILPASKVGDAAGHLFDMSDLPQGPERDWLLTDIVDLAGRFSTLMNATYLRLRLDVVTTNACRKFHTDAVTARLVCTYRGTGTQLCARSEALCEMGEPQQVYTVATGAPVLLRGTLWPATPAAGLLHRSPPIEGTGETRLVLVLDPVFDLDDAV